MYSSMWKLLQADHSYIAEVCVPILLHSLTVAGGSDVLWGLVEEDFSSQDWRNRFSAGMYTCENQNVKQGKL